jgi:hypothetical protein
MQRWLTPALPVLARQGMCVRQAIRPGSEEACLEVSAALGDGFYHLRKAFFLWVRFWGELRFKEGWVMVAPLVR